MSVQSKSADWVTLAQLIADPHGVHKRLREIGPVIRVPAIDGWLVLGRDEAIAVMRDPATFTVDDPRFSTAQVIGPSMLSLDGPEHAYNREPFVPPYLRSAVHEELEEWTSSQARRLIGSISARGRAELRTEIAGPLAAAVILRSLRLVDTSVEELLDAYRAISRTVQDISLGTIDACAISRSDGVSAYRRLERVFGETASQVPESPLSRAAQSLPPPVLASNAAVVMFGAIETSEAATANAFHHILSNPESLQTIREQGSLISAAVEESLRLEPPASSVHRYATRDAAIGGASILAGEFVSISLAAANRDPAHYEAADQFELGRANVHKHVTFASGPHACIGAHVARMQTTAAIDAALDLLPGIKIVAEASSNPEGFIFRKPVAITAVWSERTTR